MVANAKTVAAPTRRPLAVPKSVRRKSSLGAASRRKSSVGKATGADCACGAAELNARCICTSRSELRSRRRSSSVVPGAVLPPASAGGGATATVPGAKGGGVTVCVTELARFGSPSSSATTGESSPGSLPPLSTTT